MAVRRHRSAAEEEAELLEQLEKVRLKKNAEEMRAEDPRMAEALDTLERLRFMKHRAQITINGRGRGVGAAKRLAILAVEIRELKARKARDEKVLAEVDQAIAMIEEYSLGLMKGTVNGQALPSLPECIQTYRLTEAEQQREKERRGVDKAEATE